MGILFLYILIACVLLWKSSSSFETASNFLGRHMSEGVKGATINAIASSVPELLTTFFFLFFLHNEEGFSGGIGTTAGSAIFNGMIIPSSVIFMVVLSKRVKYITVSTKVFLRDGISLILAELLLIILLSTNSLHWYHGLILMLIYIAYASYTIMSMKKTPITAESSTAPQERYEKLPIWKGLWIEHIYINKSRAWQLLSLSTLIMSAACLLLVYAIEQIGLKLDIPVMFLAVVVASAASSIPDALISLRDARQGQYDDAIANALGSNIFDISFALGLPLFLYTLIYNPIEMPPDILEHTAELRLLLLSLTILSFLIFISGKRMGWKKASLLSLLYIFFLVHILARSRNWEWSQPIADALMQVWDIMSFLKI